MWLALMKAVTLLAGELLDAGDGVLLHRCLKLGAVVEHADVAALGHEPALALGQRVFEEHDHEVVAGCSSGRVSAPGRCTPRQAA